MEVVEYTPAQTLLKIVIDGLRSGESIEENLKKCNEWQRERMKAEQEVFGVVLTREITSQELRNARVYVMQRMRK